MTESILFIIGLEMEIEIEAVSNQASSLIVNCVIKD